MISTNRAEDQEKNKMSLALMKVGSNLFGLVGASQAEVILQNAVQLYGFCNEADKDGSALNLERFVLLYADLIHTAISDKEAESYPNPYNMPLVVLKWQIWADRLIAAEGRAALANRTSEPETDMPFKVGDTVQMRGDGRFRGEVTEAGICDCKDNPGDWQILHIEWYAGNDQTIHSEHVEKVKSNY